MQTLTTNYHIRTFHDKQYKVVPDMPLPIAYDIETPDNIISILETVRRNNMRIQLDFGDIKTGKSWGEVNDIKGYVGLSRGYEARYPILVYNKRSMGGGLLLTDCIVKITTTNGQRVLYQHPTYQPFE